MARGLGAPRFSIVRSGYLDLTLMATPPYCIGLANIWRYAFTET